MSIDTSKIIHAPVGGGRYTVTAPIVKEDYGLYLLIEGLELPSTYEVDFSNSEHNGTSVTMIGNADGVLIPSQFISTGKDVFAFLYHVGEDFGRTVYKFRIPNKLRPDRTDEEPTPEEQSTIDQAISALNTAVEQTAQDVIDADASAQASAESARASGESALSASNSALSSGEYASNALSHAESASASATASAQSAEASARCSADAQDSAEEAQASASASAQSATASANSASQASASATSASQSATSAQGYASQAQTSAQTASSKASEASGHASTASAKATESAQSASQALTYKNDAESAKTASQTAQGLAESARDSAISAQESAEDARDEAQSIVDGISGKVEQIDSNTERIESLEDDRYKPYPTDTASGAIASFTDGADDIPLKSLIVDINPVQDLSQGDPSPENICPISGWTEVEINHSDADMTNSTTITIDLGQTVYGGKLDVLTGELVVDRAMIKPTSVYSISRHSSGVYYCIVNNNLIPRGATKSGYFLVSDMFKKGYLNDGECYLTANGTYLMAVLPQEITTKTDAGVWMEANQPTFVYELAEPIEIQLSPNQLNSLYGQNNIFADTGDCEVEYRADTKLYIEKLTQPEEDDMIADSAITSGQFFMVGNTLYRALANIASGATITVGTNAQRVSLADALNLINT